jgi:endoglucanase
MKKSKSTIALFLKVYFLASFIFLSTGCKSDDPDKKTQTPPVTQTPEEEEEPTPIPTNTPAVERYGQLKIEGNKILDKDGKAVQLRGMSFFWSQWMGQYYTKETVKWLRDDWRCTAVRAAMGIESGGYLTNPEAEKQKVFAVIDAAIENGLYVLVDWHDHHAENHRAEAKKFFGEIAQKYGDKPNIIYEPYNEPLAVSWVSTLKPYHQAIIDTIRHHDPDNLIICGTPNWSQDVDVAANSPLPGANIGYTLHFYAGTHKAELRTKAENALKKGVALMVTEWGTTLASGDGDVFKTETNTWWKFCDDNGISWLDWSIADKVEGSAALRPGASATGNWTDANITESGKFVRAELKAKNPAP